MRFKSRLVLLVAIICSIGRTGFSANPKCEDLLTVEEPVTPRETLSRIFFRIQRDFRNPIIKILKIETNGEYLKPSDVGYLKYALHPTDETTPTFIVGTIDGVITGPEFNRFLEVIKSPLFSDIQVLAFQRCEVEHGPGIARLSNVENKYLRKEDLIFVVAKPQEMQTLGQFLNDQYSWYHQRLVPRIAIH